MEIKVSLKESNKQTSELDKRTSVNKPQSEGRRSSEDKPFRVVVNAVEDVSNENYLFKKQSSITYNINKAKTTVEEKASDNLDQVTLPLSL